VGEKQAGVERGYFPAGWAVTAPPAIKAFGGSALTGGSQKQRDWAERIRLSIVSRMSLEEAIMVCDPNGILTDARWWIEQRNLLPSTVADFVFEQKRQLAECRALRESGDAAGYAEAAAAYNALTARFGFPDKPREGLVTRKRR